MVFRSIKKAESLTSSIKQWKRDIRLDGEFGQSCSSAVSRQGNAISCEKVGTKVCGDYKINKNESFGKMWFLPCTLH